MITEWYMLAEEHRTCSEMTSDSLASDSGQDQSAEVPARASDSRAKLQEKNRKAQAKCVPP